MKSSARLPFTEGSQAPRSRSSSSPIVQNKRSEQLLEQQRVQAEDMYAASCVCHINRVAILHEHTDSRWWGCIHRGSQLFRCPTNHLSQIGEGGRVSWGGFVLGNAFTPVMCRFGRLTVGI
jgi:hypothetical protein